MLYRNKYWIVKAIQDKIKVAIKIRINFISNNFKYFYLHSEMHIPNGGVGIWDKLIIFDLNSWQGQ